MSCFPGMPCWQNTSNNNGCNPPVFTWFPCGCVPFTINSTDVIYTGNNLPNSSINTNDNLTLALAKLDSAILTSFSAGTGISYDNTTGVITNSAPDQIVTLTQGTNISITGTYPNFTISATGGGGGITNSAPNHHLPVSDGTNIIDSGIIASSGVIQQLVVDAGALGGYVVMPTMPHTVPLTAQFSNNTISVDYPFRVAHYTSSSPSVGVGVGIEFAATTSSTAVGKVGATIEAIETNIGVGTEAFDLAFRNMLGGASANETFRILSTGDINLGGTSLSGASRTLLAVGSASNIGINIFAKGTGTLNFATSGSASFSGVVQTNIGGVNVSSGSPLDNNFKGNNATGTATAAGRAVIIGGQSSINGVPGGDVIIDGGDANIGVANGGNVTITSGAGVGGGTNGSVSLAINHVNALSIDSSLNILLSAATTSMNNGFLYISGAAGPPSGTPSTFSNVVPIYYDKTNNNFYVYNGAWKKVTLT